MSEGLESAAAQLAVLAAKGTATTVANKFQAIRGKKNLEEVCNSYEELINELVAEVRVKFIGVGAMESRSKNGDQCGHSGA